MCVCVNEAADRSVYRRSRLCINFYDTLNCYWLCIIKVDESTILGSLRSRVYSNVRASSSIKRASKMRPAHSAACKAAALLFASRERKSERSELELIRSAMWDKKYWFGFVWTRGAGVVFCIKRTMSTVEKVEFTGGAVKRMRREGAGAQKSSGVVAGSDGGGSGGR